MVYSPDQTNLFDLLPPEPIGPTPEEVRAQLLGWLATARAAAHMPWSQQDADCFTILVPQMAKIWLPEPECRELSAAFAAEMDRLRAAG